MNKKRNLVVFMMMLAFVFGFRINTVYAENENTTIETATLIGVNETYTDNLLSDSDVNWYQFTVQEAGYIWLEFKHDYIESSNTYWKSYLYDASQNELANYSFSGNTTSYVQGKIGVPAGSYYLKFTDYNYSEKNYNITIHYTESDEWETEFNDELEMADAIEVNKTSYGSMRKDEDVDWYEFTVPESGYIWIEFQHDHIESSNTYWKSYLYDENVSSLVEYSFAGNTTSYVQGKIGVSSGTYYLKITDYNYSDKNYNITVNYSESDEWETEFNENFETADNIEANSNYYGTLRNSDDVDWYQFTVPESGYMWLEFNHDYVESSNTYWKAYLYDEDINELVSYSFSGDTKNYVQGHIGIPSGTYYLKIADYNYSDKNYNFTIHYEESDEWETEFNEEPEKADVLILNTVYYGSLRNSDDVDWYQFTVPGSGYIWLEFNHDYIESSNTYWKGYLYDKNMNNLATYSFSGNTTSYSEEKIQVSDGTYYLKIEDYSYSDKDYNIKINNSVENLTVPETPVITYVYSNVQTSAKVSWNKVSEADGYELYRATKMNASEGEWKLVKTVKDKDTVQYTNKGLEKGKTYYYKLRAYKINADETLKYSEYSNVAYMPATVVIDKIYSNSCSRIRLLWDEVQGAHGYQIWRKNGNGSYTVIKTIGDKGNELTENKGSVTAYSNTGLKAGQIYTYRIRAFAIQDGKKIWGVYSDEMKVPVMPEAPELSLKTSKTGQASLKWNSVDGASGYQIWRANEKSGTYSIIKTITDGEATSYLNSGLKSGKTYYYKVRAYVELDGKKTFGEYSKIQSIQVK